MGSQGSNVSWTGAGLFPAILGKGPWPKSGKMIDWEKLATKNIPRVEIYLQNQLILDCSMPSIPLEHKRLSIILISAIVSHK